MDEIITKIFTEIENPTAKQITLIKLSHVKCDEIRSERIRYNCIKLV